MWARLTIATLQPGSFHERTNRLNQQYSFCIAKNLNHPWKFSCEKKTGETRGPIPKQRRFQVCLRQETQSSRKGRNCLVQSLLKGRKLPKRNSTTEQSTDVVVVSKSNFGACPPIQMRATEIYCGALLTLLIITHLPRSETSHAGSPRPVLRMSATISWQFLRRRFVYLRILHSAIGWHTISSVLALS